jgi:hypothetical protein
MKLFLQGDRTDKTKKEAGFIHNRDLKLQHNVFGENLQQSNYAAALQPIGLQRSVVDSRLQVHISGLFFACKTNEIPLTSVKCVRQSWKVECKRYL